MEPRNGDGPRVGPFLTRRGAGEFNANHWSYHCDIKEDGIYDYLYIDDALGRTGGQGGGGVGDPEPEPINDRTGRILTTGFQDSAQGLPAAGERLQPNAVNGVVRGPVARVRVDLSDGSSTDAIMMPCAEDQNFRFFVLVFPSGLKPERVVALDADGDQVDKSPR
jgi:hypothetical protein